MRPMAPLIASLAVAVSACTGCRAKPQGNPDDETTERSHPTAAGHLRLETAPAAVPVEDAVREAMTRSSTESRRLVVYVGAVWCEPCLRFHQAASRGELDTPFQNVTLLEFDLDRDGRRLSAAGYSSAYIPLFALPSADGRASGKQVEGAVKGEGAVPYVAARLEQLLAR